MPQDTQNRDLLLPPDTYVFMQNEGKNGIISVYVGPGVVNQTGQDKPVVYDHDARRYRLVPLDQAMQVCPRADEGDYVILENPAREETNAFPTGSVQQTVPLSKGRKINIPGPWMNALWPGQTAKVVKGHRLRSNQYLLVQVYNEDEAKKNWKHAIMKTATPSGDAPTPGGTDLSNLNFTVGQRLIIKGTEVSFYIPPTGIEVVPEEAGNYVREAVTLEQLEYSILVDENGKKRIARGPQVVFPEPSERFLTDAEGRRKFRAFELNELQGIHIKVIQEYEENGRVYKEGEELFITGRETQIYFPRVEHSAIQYGDGSHKHFATAIPSGEARYVMDRLTGEIKTVRGPLMLLCDPRTQVVVRRILTDKQCELWYPGNIEALQYNRHLRELTTTTGSGRSGFVAEMEYQQQARKPLRAAPVKLLEERERDEVSQHYPGDKLVRSASYTPPRSITLDTKYDGVPSINLWTGYAVLVVSKTGERRVVQGPASILLDYDETLEVLELSTGKPKTTESLFRTVYLRTKNNKVSDIVTVETSDHVRATLKLSYLVGFEGESSRWFEVENYVKFLCDHTRSILKGIVKRHPVEEFYANYLPIIRDGVLGLKQEGVGRTGLFFPENNMRISDVEVLDVNLEDENVAALLMRAQQDVVQSNIKLNQARRGLEVVKEQERIAVETAEAKAATKKRELELTAEAVRQQLDVDLQRIVAELKVFEERKNVVGAEQILKDIEHSAQLAREAARAAQARQVDEAKADLQRRMLEAETKAAVERLQAAKENFAEALVALGREDVLVKVAEAVRIDSFLSGQTMEGALSRIFAGLPFLDQILARVKASESNGRLPAGTR